VSHLAHPGPGDGKKRLGVIGTMVWDTIHDRSGRTEPVEEWGGISYALAGFSVALPEDWEIVPIIRVGRDLSEEAIRFLREIPRLDLHTSMRIVPEPNNRKVAVFVVDPAIKTSDVAKR